MFIPFLHRDLFHIVVAFYFLEFYIVLVFFLIVYCLIVLIVPNSHDRCIKDSKDLVTMVFMTSHVFFLTK